MIKFSGQPSFRVTPYGDVDAKAFAQLRTTYDTATLLSLVEGIDRLRPLFAVEGGIRDELLRLHAMAHTVLNGAPLTVVPDGTDIWEAALEQIDNFQRIAQFIEAATKTLQLLADLAPHEK